MTLTDHWPPHRTTGNPRHHHHDDINLAEQSTMMMMMVGMESPPPPPLDNGVRQTQTTTTTTDDSDDHHCLETSKRSFSACTLSLTDSDRSYSSTSTSTSTNDQQFGTGYFERKSYRPFRSNEEYLIAMKEDLAEWLNTLYGLDLTCDNLLQRLETGVILCQ